MYGSSISYAELAVNWLVSILCVHNKLTFNSHMRLGKNLLPFAGIIETREPAKKVLLLMGGPLRGGGGG